MEHLVYCQSPLDYMRFLASEELRYSGANPFKDLQTIVALWIY